jgi:hypothetical protein
MAKSVVAFCGGLLLAGISVYLRAHDPELKLRWLWLPMSILAFAVLAWGVSQFARFRGYPGSAGCGLFALGFVIFVYLVRRGNNALVFGVWFVFATVLPVVVLSVLPDKAGHRHRGHRGGKRGRGRR